MMNDGAASQAGVTASAGGFLLPLLLASAGFWVVLGLVMTRMCG